MEPQLRNDRANFVIGRGEVGVAKRVYREVTAGTECTQGTLHTWLNLELTEPFVYTAGTECTQGTWLNLELTKPFVYFP